jgi:hypothetical protein
LYSEVPVKKPAGRFFYFPVIQLPLLLLHPNIINPQMKSILFDHPSYLTKSLRYKEKLSNTLYPFAVFAPWRDNDAFIFSGALGISTPANENNS